LNAIVSISAGFIEGSFAVAYALDGDDMLETIDDMEIYIVKPGDKDIRITIMIPWILRLYFQVSMERELYIGTMKVTYYI